MTDKAGYATIELIVSIVHGNAMMARKLVPPVEVTADWNITSGEGRKKLHHFSRLGLIG
jgi:hypothetical protein